MSDILCYLSLLDTVASSASWQGGRGLLTFWQPGRKRKRKRLESQYFPQWHAPGDLLQTPGSEVPTLPQWYSRLSTQALGNISDPSYYNLPWFNGKSKKLSTFLFALKQDHATPPRTAWTRWIVLLPLPSVCWEHTCVCISKLPDFMCIGVCLQVLSVSGY